MANYLIYCIQNVETFSYTNPMEKRARVISSNVHSFVDAFQVQATHSHDTTNRLSQIETSTLDYKNFGSYSKELKKREFKFDEKQAAKKGF